MFLSILKDSIIIFLLVFALLQLAEQVIGFLIHLIQNPEIKPYQFMVLDVSQISHEKLEYIIRNEIPKVNYHIFLISEFSDDESNHIISKLCYEYDYLYPVTRAEFLCIFNSPEAPAAYVGALKAEAPTGSR